MHLLGTAIHVEVPSEVEDRLNSTNCNNLPSTVILCTTKYLSYVIYTPILQNKHLFICPLSTGVVHIQQILNQKLEGFFKIFRQKSCYGIKIT